MRRLSLIKTAAVTAALALTTTGCLGTPAATTASTGPETAKESVSIMYAFGGSQNEAFIKDINAWSATSGVKVELIQSNSFEQLIQTKVAAGDLPDIAIFPQPGILKGLVEKGKVAELSTQVDVAAVEADILPGFLAAATVDGKVYGAPMSMNVKSLYWYDKANFAKAGLTVPKTQAELEALIEKVKGMGKTPVCYGMESGSATGWPGTDWIEDYMLQTTTPENYDKWVNHEIKFDSPEVRAAFAVYDKIIMGEGNVYGTAKAAASNAFAKALNPMFDEDPKCYIGKQGNFITQSGFFPDDVFQNLDERVGVFVTPSVSGQAPMLGGGDLAAAFTANDANVKKVMNFLVNDPTFGVELAKSGAALSPHKSFDASNYPNDITREVVKLAGAATVFRFDGSDLMPGAVGSKSFWTGMIDYTSGNKGLDDVLKAIDASWPED